MQAPIDLKRFEDLYEQFDDGHGQAHITSVRNFALELGKKYLSEKLKLIYIAATLHDIGLVEGREGHEGRGAQMILDDQQLKQDLTQHELEEIAEAVREHRASSGNPSSILAKIISDADKVSDTTQEAMVRAVKYGYKHYQELDHEGQIWRAAKHLKEKFGENGTGSRVYFPESTERLKQTFSPIISALDANDFATLKSLVTYG